MQVYESQVSEVMFRKSRFDSQVFESRVDAPPSYSLESCSEVD